MALQCAPAGESAGKARGASGFITLRAVPNRIYEYSERAIFDTAQLCHDIVIALPLLHSRPDRLYTDQYCIRTMSCIDTIVRSAV